MKKKRLSVLKVLSIIIVGASLLVSCNNINRQESINLIKSKDIEINGISFRIGDNPPDGLLQIIKTYSINTERDFTALLGTTKSLTSYMEEHKEFMKNKATPSEATIDAYIVGYNEATNTRMLGGTTEKGYSSLTVFNPTDEFTKVEDSYIKSFWILNSTDEWSYDNISSGDSAELIDDSYSEKQDTTYSDKEFTKVDNEINVVVYVTNDEITGLKVSY